MEAACNNDKPPKPSIDASSPAGDSEDETEVLEESPCGRWHKRREKVRQRDVPGIDVAYLAMDNELGVEVVWNEVHFSERKRFRAEEETIRHVFDKLIKLDHPNLIKLHSYWLDSNSEKPRVIFITEYMSSGSISQFLKRTSQSSKTLSIKGWKKWCIPVLWALDYLHSFEPPIVHGNLTCDTIFIQQNGLIKIGCVTPDAIHQHVKSRKENMRNFHYVAPEIQQHNSSVSPQSDIYAFGVCSLEMATLGFTSIGAEGSAVTMAVMDKAVGSLDDPLQKNMIRRCVADNPKCRPCARELLFHRVLFEVPSLKLLCCHALVRDSTSADSDVRIGNYDKSQVIAEIVHKDRPSFLCKQGDVSAVDLDKMVEDVRNGIYPLTAFRRMLSNKPSTGLLHGSGSTTPAPPASQTDLLDRMAEASYDEAQPEHYAPEERRVVEMNALVRRSEAVVGKPCSGPGGGRTITLLLKFDDQMTRELESEVNDTDSALSLIDELIRYGLVSESDREVVGNLIADSMTTVYSDAGTPAAAAAATAVGDQ